MNNIVWADVPVSDLKRASKFYSELLGKNFTQHSYGDMSFSLCEHKGDEVAFCLVLERSFQPQVGGTLVYFNVEGRMNQAINAIEVNGGKILEEKQKIGDYGYRVILLDSEGNRIALHASTDS